MIMRRPSTLLFRALSILFFLCLVGTAAAAREAESPPGTGGGRPDQANAAQEPQEPQEPGRVVGTVLLEGEEPVHAAIVLILETTLSTTSHSDGRYEIENVPPGTYQIMAQRQGLG